MEKMEELRDRVVVWHEHRFPKTSLAYTVLKLTEEAGEVSGAVGGIAGDDVSTGDGIVAEELADVMITVLAVWGRYFPEVDLLGTMELKVAKLETPGQHCGSPQLPWANVDVYPILPDVNELHGIK